MSKRPSDIPAARVKALNLGAESSNLAELLSIDFAKLFAAAVPTAPASAIDKLKAANREKLGILARMSLASDLLTLHAPKDLPNLASHTSDTIRGWACLALVRAPKLSFAQRLKAVRPFANDPNSGVREWAWMALRPAIADNLDLAIDSLIPFTTDPSANIRRFATEATRPRGVWCAHITELKSNPAPALPLLQPLNSDPTKYVQDSVSNWLNDAAKSCPDWVRDLTSRWLKESDTAATRRICRRALRSID